MRHGASLSLAAFALVAAAACTGVIEAPGASNGSSAGSGGGTKSAALNCKPGTIRPGAAPLRRLTNAEYDNTVRDLLGDTSQPGRQFTPDAQSLGFDNNADAQSVSQLLAEQYETAAQALSTKAVENVPALMGCDPVSGGEPCVRGFVESFGARAYRRPLATPEVDRLVGFYTTMRTEYGVNDGVRLMLQAMLQSPHFLYRIELGGTPAGGDAVRLSPHELATRLSYFLWATMPDDELFAAADAGQLSTQEQIATQARRMLDDPKARDSIRSFFRQWLFLDRMDSLAKDATLYPEFKPALGPLMRQETQQFVDHVMFEGDRRLHTLLRADFSFMNAELASFYGEGAAPAGSGFQKVSLDPKRRSGLLTHAGLLALHAHTNQTSLVERGKFVLEQLLCQDLPPPPQDLVVVPPDPDPNSTTRERFEAHVADPACAGCHLKTDSIGFAFEHYDAAGRWRDTENGLAIDSKGALYDTDVDGEVKDAIELAEKLASSEQVMACAVNTWFRYGHGRAQSEDDACSLEQARKVFQSSGGDLRELIVALVQTDAFLYRRGSTP